MPNPSSLFLVLVSLFTPPSQDGAAETQSPTPAAAQADAQQLAHDYAAALAAKRSTAVLEVGARLKELGPGAAPALDTVLAALDYGPKVEVRQQARELLDSIGLAALMPLVRRAIDSGRTEIEGFAPADADAVERLFAQLEIADELERKWIAIVLDNLGEPAFEELRRRLRETGGVEQVRAAQAAAAMAWRGGALVEELTAHLKSTSAPLRYWACFALGRAQPQSTPVLLDALKHDDARVRIAACEALSHAIDAVRSSSRHPDVAPYEAWHGVTRDMNSEAKRFRAIADHGVPQLAAALGDSEPLVRMFAAVTLEKLGARAREAREALVRAYSDSQPSVRVWAQLALRRVDASYYDLAEALTLGAPESAPQPSAEQIAQWWTEIDNAPEWDADEGEDDGTERWNEKPDVRWNAALGLARCCGRELLAKLASDKPEDVEAAKSRLESIERESWRHVIKLLGLIQGALGSHDRAQAELRAIGPALVGELRQDYLRYPRFPIGDGSYEQLTALLGDWGPAGLATLVYGLEHWSYFGRPTAADELIGAGAAVADFAPAILSVWRIASDSPRAPGLEAWWDGRDRGGAALGDMWEISESGGGESKWGDIHGLRERDNVALLARALGAAAVPHFVNGLSDEHSVVRARSATSLMALGDDAKPHLAKLAALLADNEQLVRRSAARALVTLAPADSADAALARKLLESR
mgnify:CR=1 FL=1